MENNTLFINIFGGPGSGKSTYSAIIFFIQKMLQINTEYIQEYAKDKTWEHNHGDSMHETLKCQPYVTGKQFYRCARINGKVTTAVTDSPACLGLLYQGFGCNEFWEKGVVETFKSLRNLNIYLVRNSDAHPYNQSGRRQKEDEAKQLDIDTKNMLEKHNIPYHTVYVEDTVIDEENETIYSPTAFAIWKLIKAELNNA